ncbi:hypothetical protein BC940DRAFT_305391 [Gongronella butleri]|nr:hypothetical protein BC940DRAFT_305391 [Gongronella butleri]
MDQSTLDLFDAVGSPPLAQAQRHIPSPIPANVDTDSFSSSPLRLSTSTTPSLHSTLATLGPALTSNASFYDIPVTDALTDLLERYVPPDQRPERPGTQQQLLAIDEDTLQSLVAKNHWRGVARYAKQKLLQTPPTDMATILQLWHTRLLALYKLAFYQLAAAEFEKLGDLLSSTALADDDEDLVPFEMRVLWALLPNKLQHAVVALERLATLMIQCQRRRHAQRERQVALLLVSQWIHMNDMVAASKTLHEMVQKYTSDAAPNLDLLSSLGRLYLQLGDLQRAEDMFNKVEQGMDTASNKSWLQENINMNKSMMATARGDWTMSRQILEQLLEQNSNNVVAASNLAVCMLYQGQLTEAIQLLERLIQQHPDKAGTSEICILNLCTLYELRYQGDTTTQKKVDVTKFITRWVGDSFNTQCLKL